jgi:hypothetical protein
MKIRQYNPLEIFSEINQLKQIRVSIALWASYIVQDIGRTFAHILGKARKGGFHFEPWRSRPKRQHAPCVLVSFKTREIHT